MLLLMLLVDIDGADGGNIGCKLMSDVPNDDDEFTDLIVNGSNQIRIPLRLSVCHCACVLVFR